MHTKKYIAITICLLFILNFFIITVNAEENIEICTEPITIYVDDDNTEGPWDGTIEHPYKEIQDGIDNASDGDTVFVHNGTYVENIVINKSITLTGENRINTIIDANENGDTIYISADYVYITGFSILHSGDNYLHDAGIDIDSNYNSIMDNTIKNNICDGITLRNSRNNIISNNNINNNGGIGIELSSSSNNNTISSNIINNNGNGGMHLEDSFNNTISTNVIENSGYDNIDLDSSSNNTISDNIIKNNSQFEGISLSSSSNFNSISNNTIINNNLGAIDLYCSCNYNIITDNTIKNNNLNAIDLYESSNNIISDNIIENNRDGAIDLSRSSNNNIISGNTIKNNGDPGLDLSYCSDNIVYHNNFINNILNAYDWTGHNIWYNTSLLGGNYWDDYTGTDLDNNGIGDTPYDISGGDCQDLYPLMKPYGSDEPPLEPELSVSIDTGFGLLFNKVSASVENTGDVAAFNVNLSLYVEYGLLNNKVNSSVEISVLEVGSDSDPHEIEGLRGFGPIEVTAKASANNAETVDTKLSGWIIGRFIILIS